MDNQQIYQMEQEIAEYTKLCETVSQNMGEELKKRNFNRLQEEEIKEKKLQRIRNILLGTIVFLGSVFLILLSGNV